MQAAPTLARTPTMPDDCLLAAEPLIRLGAFAGVLLAMALWEALAPRRAPAVGRMARWPSNLGVVVVDALVLRLLFPTAAVGLAIVGEGRGWGLLGAVGWPWWAEAAAAVVLLDLAVYLQHVLFHAVPLLWRLHRMHHADLDFDVTTGLRFHPAEVVLSMLLKLAAVAAVLASSTAPRTGSCGNRIIRGA